MLKDAMETTAAGTLRADRAVLLQIGAQLTDGQWLAASGCPGWPVKDVISHPGALYWLATEPPGPRRRGPAGHGPRAARVLTQPGKP